MLMTVPQTPNPSLKRALSLCAEQLIMQASKLQMGYHRSMLFCLHRNEGDVQCRASLRESINRSIEIVMLLLYTPTSQDAKDHMLCVCYTILLTFELMTGNLINRFSFLSQNKNTKLIKRTKIKEFPLFLFMCIDT